MKRILLFALFLSLNFSLANSQTRHYFLLPLDPFNAEITAEPTELSFPVSYENVKAVGMGNTQIANGTTFNAMLYNPAFLARSKRTFEVFGMSVGMPPETYDAAWFLADNMDEFIDATSLTQIYDAADAFFQAENNQQRLDCLHDIQEGMQFTLDLVEQVTGPYDDPARHGISIVPSINVQYDNWGFSLYGYGYSGFTVLMSPTLENLVNINIPNTLDYPVQVARTMAQVLATLGTVIIGPGQGFREEVYPVALYMAYIDAVGTVGYGYQLNDNWLFGANLKLVNRRFSINRIAVEDYDQILNEALSILDAGIVGVTGDVGCLFRSPFGTNFGLSLQNIIPIQSINKEVDLNFRIPRVVVLNGKNGQPLNVNADQDTAMAVRYTNIEIHRPFELKSPFIASLGISHPVTPNWDISADWVDIAEQDSRYDKTTERFRLGTEYRINFWNNKLGCTLRVGMADEKVAFGLGLNLTKYVQIDGAYAYDRFVDSFAYFGQLKFGW